MLLGIISMISLYLSPLIIYKTILIFNYCDVSSNLLADEITFNSTVSPLLLGFEDLVLPCMIKEERNIYHYLPFSESFNKLENYRKNLTQLSNFDKSLLKSNAVKNFNDILQKKIKF